MGFGEIPGWLFELILMYFKMKKSLEDLPMPDPFGD